MEPLQFQVAPAASSRGNTLLNDLQIRIDQFDPPVKQASGDQLPLDGRPHLIINKHPVP
jgi:hypothetical protein